jgi:hypothetical protein
LVAVTSLTSINTSFLEVGHDDRWLLKGNKEKECVGVGKKERAKSSKDGVILKGKKNDRETKEARWKLFME